MPALIKKPNANGKTYWYIVENVDGKRKYLQSLGTIGKRQAQQLLKDFERQPDHRSMVWVIREFYAHYKTLSGIEVSQNTYKTEKYFQYRLESFFIDKSTKNIGHKEIDQLKAYLASERLSNRTINLHLITLKKIFKYAINQGYINQIPQMKKLPENYTDKEIQYLTKEKYREALTHADKDLAFFMGVMVYSGIRPEEINKLTWDSINLEERYIDIDSIRSNKKGRRIPISQKLYDILDSRKEKTGRLSPYNTRWSAQTRLQRIGTLIGTKLTPYTLRKTFGSWLVQAGVDILTVADLMGHKNIEVTRKHYARLVHDNLKSAMELL